MKSVRLKAELDMLELEERFVAAKQAGEATPGLRAELREARRRFRELREQGIVGIAGQADGADGAAKARPGTVSGRGGVKGQGA